MVNDKQYGVTFDLWRTLIGEPDGGAVSPIRNARREECVMRVLEKYGIAVDIYAIRSALEKTTQTIHEDHSKGADMLFSDRVLQMLEMIGEGTAKTLGETGLAEMHTTIDNVFVEAPPQIFPDALELVKGSKGMNLRVGIISNTGFTSPKAYRHFLDSSGMTQFLDFIVLSNDFTAAKPNPAIFRIALQGLGLEAHDTIHVGDDPRTDVKGASEASMSTVYLAKPDAPAPDTMPDFRVSSLYEVLPVLERWLSSR